VINKCINNIQQVSEHFFSDESNRYTICVWFELLTFEPVIQV